MSAAEPSFGSGLYVDELFDEISQLPRPDREARLAERCAGHPSVEAEVRALLRAVESDEEPTSGPVPQLAPGARIGRYRLEQALGTGATASVWKAFDTRLHAFTALKLLHPDGRIRGPRALEAVLHEARAASAIISDHVVRIKTAGVFEDGPHFVEMELCAEHRAGPEGSELLEIGRSLADAPPTSIRERVRVVAEAARGVEAAHRVGVLHRDLKPGNILLTPVSHRAKVADFGLAAEQLYPPPGPDTPPTATVTVLLEAKDGRVVGTPAYMAPEQAMGHPATRAADVYALGATLYALFAGRSPYVVSGRHPVPALDVLAQVRDGPPPPLDGVPHRLRRVVARAMERSPRDRYRTAAEFAADLEAWLADRPMSVDGRAPGLRLGLFAKRNREVVGTAGVLLLVLLGFALALGWLDLRRRELEADIARAMQEQRDAAAAAEQAARVRDSAEAEKREALLSLDAAEEARRTALEGESNAERRWREELERRKAADEARTLAEEARNAAESERVATAAARDAALAEAEAARLAAAEATTRAEQEEASRLEADALARAAQLSLVEAQTAAEELEGRLVEAERERDELSALLEGIRAQAAAAVGEPEPAAPSP